MAGTGIMQPSEMDAWWKSDLLDDFGDLLEDRSCSDVFRPRTPVTLGSDDLLGAMNTGTQHNCTQPQIIPTDWIDTFNATMPRMEQSSPALTDFSPLGVFEGIHSSTTCGPQAIAKPSRSPQCDSFTTPGSWESDLSNYSLQSSLTDQACGPGHQLKAEASLETLCNYQEPKKEPQTKRGKTKTAASDPAIRAALADRNRERQQRFRRRQKTMIEDLQSEVKRLTSQRKVLCAEKASASNRASQLEALLQSKDRDIALLTKQTSQLHCSPTSGSVKTEFAEPSLLLTFLNPPQMLTDSQIAGMDALVLSKIWGEYVWTLDGMLKNNVSQGEWSTESENMDAATSELIHLMMKLWSSSTDFANLKASGVMLLDSSHQRDESEDDNWQRIARQITLTPEKLAQLTTLRSMMSDKRLGIWAARREVQNTLMTCLEQPVLTSKTDAIHHEKMKKVNDQLNSTIKEERLLSRDFEYALYKKVLRPEQCALCIVQAYPRFPDSQAIANWIAACHGDKEAQCLITTHASSSATSHRSNT